MQYNYPDWSEKAAKAGAYTVGSKVAYKSSDGIERVFQANEGYTNSIKPPDNDNTWDYLEDIIYDWNASMDYKIGSVVYYNKIQYVATRRYRGGKLPPSDEVDLDGIRTWMLNYEDGTEPVTPFFYRKKFGAMSFTEVYPYTNFMEGIEFYGIPIYLPDENGEFADSTINNDRFFSQRENNQILQFPSNLDRRPEQQLANSVMEAHPYHDIYEMGEYKYVGPVGARYQVFEWFDNAKHKSEIRDKFWGDYVTDKRETRFFTPKRTIPYWSNRFSYELDSSSFSQLKNGVSLEYYPNESSDNFELMMTEYSRGFTFISPLYFFEAYGGPRSVSDITPIWVSNSGASLTVNPVNGEEHSYSNTKMEIYVKPKNICLDSVKITFYFAVRKVICWVSGYSYGQPIISCADPVYSYFQQTYEYNELTRTASADYTDRFKSKQYKLVENPDYDPDCVSEDTFNPCPFPYIRVVDDDYPDTSIEMRSYLQISGGESSVSIIGWSIS